METACSLLSLTGVSIYRYTGKDYLFGAKININNSPARFQPQDRMIVSDPVIRPPGSECPGRSWQRRLDDLFDLLEGEQELFLFLFGQPICQCSVAAVTYSPSRSGPGMIFGAVAHRLLPRRADDLFLFALLEQGIDQLASLLLLIFLVPSS